MRILYITAVAFTVEHFLLSHINYLLSKGLEVEIACSPGATTDKLIERGYIVHPIEIERQINPISNLKSIINLKKLIEERHYNAVHVHTPIASVLGRIAARLANVQKIIYTCHGFYFHEYTPFLKYHLFYTIEKFAAGFTTLIFSVNREDIETIKITNLCSLEKLHYLGSTGIDVHKFNPNNLDENYQEHLKASLGIPQDIGPIIGTIGRLTKEKGGMDLVEAIAKIRLQFPNIHALVVGGQLSSERDEFEEKLRKKISEMDIGQHITLTGYRKDIPELIGLMDVFVLPSYREGLGNVILEAMAMEKPAVAYNIRGCREAIVHEQTGLLAPPMNSELLADAILTLLNDPQRCQQMGVAGRQRILQEYEESQVLERLAEGYKKIGILI